jgi:hypothetical protein
LLLFLSNQNRPTKKLNEPRGGGNELRIIRVGLNTEPEHCFSVGTMGNANKPGSLHGSVRVVPQIRKVAKLTRRIASCDREG